MTKSEAYVFVVCLVMFGLGVLVGWGLAR